MSIFYVVQNIVCTLHDYFHSVSPEKLCAPPSLYLPKFPIHSTEGRGCLHFILLYRTIIVIKCIQFSTDKTSDESKPKYLTTLDPKIRADLRHQLKLNFKQISRRYGSFVNYIRKSIIEKKISADDLCAYLLSLPALKSGDSERQVMLLSEISDKLEKAATINEIFNILNRNYATFLNYEIFQCIAEEYEVDPNHVKMNYPDHLDAYVKMHKLYEFKEVNPMLKKVECGSDEIVLKFDIELTCSLAKLQDYTSNIADILGLRPSALRLLSVEEGCVVVTLHIPAPLVDLIFTTGKRFTPEDVKRFQALSILWLKCNGHAYDFSGTYPGDRDGQNFKKEAHSGMCMQVVIMYTIASCSQCHKVGKFKRLVHNT